MPTRPDPELTPDELKTLSPAEIMREVAHDLMYFDARDPWGTICTTPELRYEYRNYSTSPYICDRLSAYHRPAEQWVRQFLIALGMGCGYSVFGEKLSNGSFTPDQQHQRAAWLLFAADLYEEWDADGTTSSS